MSQVKSSYHIQFATAFICIMAMLASCIEDGITTSAADQPEFSCDTLRLGTIFTDEGTPTYSFRVYNRHNKILSISSIAMASDGSDMFRLNVDGQSGTRFSNVEIRPNDSIYVFVAATLPANGTYAPIDMEECIEFITNGVSSKVIVTAQGQDVERLRGTVIDTDTRWEADRPRQIFDSVVVAPGATLTIEAGARLYFHDKARMTVRGTLVTEGTPDAPIDFGGDRQGNVVADIPFDLMSKQWHGLEFTSTSKANRMSHTVVRNTTCGVTVDSITDTSAPALTLTNCRLRNSDGYALQARHSSITAIGSEFAEAGSGAVYLCGGNHTINHCTFSNYYLFSIIRGACLQLSHYNEESDDGSGLPYTSGEITNSIIYGSSSDMSPSDLNQTQVYVRRCLIRSAGTDDEHFTDIIWDTDPLFYTVRTEYIFDYRLKPESPAIEASYPAYDTMLPATDFYGMPHSTPASLGAYEPKAPEAQ